MTLYQLSISAYLELQSLYWKTLVVNVWATWCLPCRREMPMLNETVSENPELLFYLLIRVKIASRCKTILLRLTFHQNMFYLIQVRIQPISGCRRLSHTFFYDAKGQQMSASYGELSRATLNDHLKHIRDISPIVT